jgi:hypothetical protein
MRLLISEGCAQRDYGNGTGVELASVHLQSFGLGVYCAGLNPVSHRYFCCAIFGATAAFLTHTDKPLFRPALYAQLPLQQLSKAQTIRVIALVAT